MPRPSAPRSSTSLRRRLVDVNDPGSISSRLRAKRWELFVATYPDLASMTVLDLGGTRRGWQMSPVQPAELFTVNVAERNPSRTALEGDACDPPAELDGIAFDLVFSNSTIEHLGGYERREQFARVVRERAPHHWVQTPYRYFPVEPHWLFPGFQFLPVAAKLKVARSWPLANRTLLGREGGAAQMTANVFETELISITDLRRHFPDSKVLVERAAGLPKSITAYR